MSESNEVLTEPTLERRTRRRFSAAEKQRWLAEADALPHGEQGAWLRRNGLYAAPLSQWRKALGEHGTPGLEPKRGGRKAADPRDREIERRRRENARPEHRAQVAEDWVALQKNSRTSSNRPAARPRHECVGRTSAPCAAQPRLCGAGALAHRHLPARAPVQPRALSAPDRAQIRALAHSAPDRDASLPVIHATERNAGRVVASLSTFDRVLRADGETRERRAQRAPGQHAVPHRIADRTHACRSRDIAKLPTLEPGRYLNLYLILDLYSRYVIAWMISAKENGALAKHLFRQALARYEITDGQLTVHQDRGAPMIAATFRDRLARFGVARRYARPRVSNDNAASESLFKTVQYSPAYPGRFADLDDARAWLTEFIAVYQERPHEGIAFDTPADVFHGRIDAVHARRQAALDAHFAAHPQRYPHGAPAAKRPPAAMAINPRDGITVIDGIGATAQPETVGATPVWLPQEKRT